MQGDPSPEAGRGGEELSRFGYAQELLRAMGGFSSFALSFSIISVVTGIITTYNVALAAAGPAGIGLGWPLVSFGTLFVALSMAELASAFPTAGALYHWSALLGGKGFGWTTAMTNVTGQVAIVAAIDLGLAQQMVGFFGWPAGFATPLYAILLASHAAFNLLWVKLVAVLNDLSAVVHIVGSLVLISLLFFAGRAHGASYLAHTGFTLREDHSYAIGFLNSLLLGMFTFTGYDASAHLAEETKDAPRRAPIGILTSVIVSAIVGYALAASITLAIGDLEKSAADEHAALFIVEHALGTFVGRAAMALALFAMWFCGLASMTSASRTLFAFARDGGVPRVLAFVSETFRTPVYAICIFFAAPLLLVLFTRLFSDDVFGAVAGMSAMALYVSYGLPIALGAVARARGRWTKRGPFSLGIASIPIAAIAVVWCVFVLVACGWPPNFLAAKFLAASLVTMLLVYVVFLRNRFKGPPVKLDDLEPREDKRKTAEA